MSKKPKVRSSYESQFIEILESAGLDSLYEPMHFSLNIVTKTKYKPDFKVGNLYLECKGNHRFVKPSLLKLKAFREQYPNEQIIMVAKEIDSPITKWKSKTLRKFCDDIDIKIYDMDNSCDIIKLMQLLEKHS